jgi:protein SCO1/2
MMKSLSLLSALVFLFVSVVTVALGQSGASAESALSPSNKYFTDVLLIDQDGKSQRLYSDLIKGRVVIVNAMFTTCVSVCPMMNHNMQMIQERLGDRLGKDVVMLSFTVDPANDTPPALKAYAAKFQAKPGWYFLTGKKESLEFALRKFGQHVENRDDHTTLIIIGNDRTGLWKKAFGMAKTAALIEVVETVLNDIAADAK